MSVVRQKITKAHMQGGPMGKTRTFLKVEELYVPIVSNSLESNIR